MTQLQTNLTVLALFLLATKFYSMAIVISAVWITTLVGQSLFKYLRGALRLKLPAT